MLPHFPLLHFTLPHFQNPQRNILVSKSPKMRSVQVAKRPGSESSMVVAKRSGGELAKLRIVLLPEEQQS